MDKEEIVKITNRYRKRIVDNEMTIQLLVKSIYKIREELKHSTEIQSPNQRLNIVNSLLRQVNELCDHIEKNTHKRRLGFYGRRLP